MIELDPRLEDAGLTHRAPLTEVLSLVLGQRYATQKTTDSRASAQNQSRSLDLGELAPSSASPTRDPSVSLDGLSLRPF